MSIAELGSCLVICADAGRIMVARFFTLSHLWTSSHQMSDQSNKKEYKKDKEKDPGDACRRDCDTRKAENCGNYCNNEENSCPVKHSTLLL